MEHVSHVISVVALVKNEQSEVLLINHPRRGWEPPGGKVDPGEDLISAVKREVWEETGIEISPTKILGLYSDIKYKSSIYDKLTITFAAVPTGGKLLARPGESLEVGWHTVEDSLKMVNYPSRKQMLSDALLWNGIVYRKYTMPDWKLLNSVSL